MAAMNWHREILPVGWTHVAGALVARQVSEGCYLAGGTALALWFGHRRSDDVDLFTREPFDAAARRDRLLGLDGLENVEVSDATLYFQLRGIKVSVLAYPYPLLFPLADFNGLHVADSRDIACMKVDATASRGARRDFVDLYTAMGRYDLPTILGWFAQKYAATAFNRAHILKSLTYFDDADLEPEPEMLASLDWRELKDALRREAAAMARWRDV